MVNVNQPDEFFPWLAQFVGAAGPFRCDEAVADETGTLTFILRHDENTLHVAWSVVERRDGQLGYRDGSVGVAGGEGLDPRARTLAVRQVLSRLDALLHKRRPGLLERRNREVQAVPFGPSTVETLCGDLLRTGATRCGLYKLQHLSFERDRVQLVFQGVGPKLVLQLQRRDAPAEGVALGTYGPLRLEAPAGVVTSSHARRVVRHIGYVLALSTHPAMEIQASADPKTPLGDKANPFLFDGISCGTIVMTAVFASKGRVVPVIHADRECAGFASYLTGPTETVYLPQTGMRPTVDYLRRMRMVDTNELDAVMSGCQSKLTSLVKQSMDEHDPELMIVFGTCVSRVIGDDVAMAVEDAGVEERGVPTLWLETTATERDQHHRILWDRLVDLFQRDAPHGDGPSVNLLGYGYWRTESLGELTHLLERAGIRHNASLIPSFDVQELRRFGAADVNVIYPSVHIHDSLLWVKPKLRAPTLEPPAPFGMRGTRAWLDSVRSFFQLAPVTDDWLDEALGPLRDRWDRLRAEAGSVQVAVVLTSDHFGSQAPLARHGLRWFDVLQEMGFVLNLFIVPSPTRQPDPATAETAIDAARAVLDGRPSHRVTPVASVALLQDALRGSGAHLLYTEVPQDRRATTVGLTPVNYLDFHMGFEGACRTLERLLHLARVPFNRRYGRFLPRPEWSA